MTDKKEGEMYKRIKIEGRVFDIYYGYYSESERQIWKPTPLFPDFAKCPTYTESGCPFVTAEQDVCEDYTPKQEVSGENWCNDCIFFRLYEEIIGICLCEKRKKDPNEL